MQPETESDPIALLVRQFDMDTLGLDLAQTPGARKKHTARFVQSIDGLTRRFPGTKPHYFDPYDIYPPFIDLSNVTKPLEIDDPDTGNIILYVVSFDSSPDDQGNMTRLYRGLEAFDPDSQRMSNLFHARLYVKREYTINGRETNHRTIPQMRTGSRRATDREVMFGSRFLNRYSMMMDEKYSIDPETFAELNYKKPLATSL